MDLGILGIRILCVDWVLGSSPRMTEEKIPEDDRIEEVRGMIERKRENRKETKNIFLLDFINRVCFYGVMRGFRGILTMKGF